MVTVHYTWNWHYVSNHGTYLKVGFVEVDHGTNLYTRAVEKISEVIAMQLLTSYGVEIFGAFKDGGAKTMVLVTFRLDEVHEPNPLFPLKISGTELGKLIK